MRNTRVILTNMCMLYNDSGEFLVINRENRDWPGINFPGGHVEDDESIEESVIREMKEETGLDIQNVEQVGYYEWNIPQDGIRHLAILFRTKDYVGEIHSSNEGKVFFMRKEELPGHLLSLDFDKVLDACLVGLPF